MSDIIITVISGGATVKIEMPAGEGRANVVRIDNTRQDNGIQRGSRSCKKGTVRPGIDGRMRFAAGRKTVLPGAIVCPDDAVPNDAGHMYVGARIQAQLVRRLEPLTYADVAGAAIDRRDFALMLNNRRRASAKTWAKLAALFGVTVEEFLAGRAATMNEPADTPTPEKAAAEADPIEMATHPVAAEPIENLTKSTQLSEVEPPKDESPKQKKPRYETLDISCQLNAWLTERGITALELYRLSGVFNGEISKFRRGLQKPSMVTIERLAKGFGVSVEEFLAGPKGEFIPAATVPESSDAALDAEPPAGMTVLEQWMEAKGKSPQDIANALSLPIDVVRRMKDGSMAVGEHMGKRLSGVFRVSVERFREGPKETDFHDPAFSAPAIGRINSDPLAGKDSAA